ncbi:MULTISPECIES: thrombospondin type 3 repeat-containing protein [unclassified Arenibacter]|uniref:thrombospondin type 3 repeat-containing protein n=1 Tax=unclassified Arenibacter TaxID=2615047 RepID=UPI000E3570E2|nr:MULTISPECIES: thrombospondin type 3 repeat-containing protein [unclassified Arenibacter]MCM4162990.1 hypothetical protein [Arenibacter sp. A80]RFT57029.1 hypothetical protein D0S24_05225 [Arenibacter sp. P308M17]
MKKILLLVFITVLSVIIDSCSEEDIKVYKFTSSISPAQGGTVNPSEGSYISGEEVTVTAQASSGYVFKNWSGSATGNKNPVTITMNSDKAVIAMFELLDTDDDGVPDYLDQCPNTHPGEIVDENGCANSQKDSDGDGVNDTTDLCPETPKGESVGVNGCSDSQMDSDGDGIADDIDLCAETPDGEIVNETGCSTSQTDSDEDTIPDALDLCPDTPSGGTVDEFGCSSSQKDSDLDGITDDLDKCQNTPVGESVSSTGCSATQVDSDRDTLTDDLDQCPKTPKGETIDAQGCSPSQKDDDGDGINNLLDQCPGTPNGEGVNSVGCSSTQEDIDGDGIKDNLDQCSGTPEGETADAKGCSDSQKDTDVDGVSDDLDQCPGTPSGETVNSQGCSETQRDSDGDTVKDELDQCPNTPLGESVDTQGCSASQKDTDNDGVKDNKDICPGTPSGVTVNSQGCSSSQIDSDNDGVNDDDDLCSDTVTGEIVDADGCSDRQKDKSPPVVTGFTITNVTATSFSVDWSLDEVSKGYIQFGTSSGVYIGSTTIENNYLNRHVQTIGGTNPFPLNPGTTYYWRIYTEDQYGNTGISSQQITTTLEEISRTSVPDDAFEQNLIDMGYDDVLDNFVNTANIDKVTSLQLGNCAQICNQYFISDYTGLQDFRALEELSLYGQNITLNLSENSNLKKLIVVYSHVDVLDLNDNIALEELRFFGDEPGTGSNTSINQINGLEKTINLKILEFALTSATGMQGIIDSTKSIEQLVLRRPLSGLYDNAGNYVVNLTNNSNLKEIIFDAGYRGGGGILPHFVNLKNGANEKIQTIFFDNFGYTSPSTCIEADTPLYIQGTISGTEEIDTSNITVTTDCGY